MTDHFLGAYLNEILFAVTTVAGLIAAGTTYLWKKAKKVIKNETFDERVEETLERLEEVMKKLCEKLTEETKAAQETHEKLVQTANRIQKDVAKLQGEMSIMKKLMLKGKTND